mmetsp:Transcript_163080/g.522951  ORF Transcript_163080/g.522951 Transcript_163080/m.522951 type:complete len:230 (+) Transcript_163080:1047-1736(+)
MPRRHPSAPWQVASVAGVDLCPTGCARATRRADHPARGIVGGLAGADYLHESGCAASSDRIFGRGDRLWVLSFCGHLVFVQLRRRHEQRLQRGCGQGPRGLGRAAVEAARRLGLRAVAHGRPSARYFGPPRNECIADRIASKPTCSQPGSNCGGHGPRELRPRPCGAEGALGSSCCRSSTAGRARTGRVGEPSSANARGTARQAALARPERLPPGGPRLLQGLLRVECG